MRRNDFSCRWTYVLLLMMVPISQGQAEEVDPVVDLWAKGVEVAGYLFIFVVLAALLIHLSKRYQPSWGGRGAIDIIDGRTLGPGMGIRLIRIGSRAWLLGVTRERISLLAELNAAELPAGKSTDSIRSSGVSAVRLDP
ncbi:MAG: flagellar biosynthetic protein FliO [Magnetococcales bacterium]|nr:flagellar biosynthetic protein FliO [Magnetococcales bacterium]MBF0148544.1 flagellar biosynthetic protein FliO [Magnetococcales bacterium]MBF0629762.1 flagellar biosynthetic protein FliO [Magnetococcales bacterium]